MPYAVVEARWLCPKVRWIKVQSPHVTHNCRAGQFVIARPYDTSERIPLTIADSDRQQGTILLIVQVVGATTAELCQLEVGQAIQDVAGPLGKPTDIEDVGHAVIVGGGVGTAVIYPQAKALKEAGNKVTAIIGGRNQKYVILEQQLRAVCDEVLVCTDDGSYGFHGFVTNRLKMLLDEATDIRQVLCAGPVPMMRAVAEVTRALAIATVASLNPIMVDGTGMCGGCRVSCNGQIKFACVDGPEFDAHQVNFDELAERLNAYREHEKCAVSKVNLAEGWG